MSICLICTFPRRRPFPRPISFHYNINKYSISTSLSYCWQVTTGNKSSLWGVYTRHNHCTCSPSVWSMQHSSLGLLRAVRCKLLLLRRYNGKPVLRRFLFLIKKLQKLLRLNSLLSPSGPIHAFGQISDRSVSNFRRKSRRKKNKETHAG